jgi:predicted DNA-binding protein with PD1-like motif
MHVIEIKNAELLAGIAAEARRIGIKDGAIVSLIGAADSFTVSTMPKDDPLKDNISEYGFPAEFTGTGEIIDGAVHIHAVLAIEGDKGISGHLHKAMIGTWFARAYVIDF